MAACSATDNMSLLILFVSGALAACPEKTDLFITAPQEMEALSGSCLLIPCSFTGKPEGKFDSRKLKEQFDSRRETFGVWIKSDHSFKDNPDNVIFNSSERVNVYPMRITGNLSQKNCTTLFSNLTTSYTDKYYFRIENTPFLATAVCDLLQITVKDSPPRPRLEIPADLKEKESVTLTCSASTPCPHSPPHLTWNLQQDPQNSLEKNTDGTFTTRIQKSVTLSDQHDGYNITCSARYPVDEGKRVQTAEDTNILCVSYAPKNTLVSVSPPGGMSAGGWVNLTCSSRAKPPVSRFTWFKSSKDGVVAVSEGRVYSFNVTAGAFYYCVATNDLGNETSPEIHLTSKELPASAVLGGLIGLIVLICLGVGVCTLMWWRRSRTTEVSTQQQSQGRTGEELAAHEPERKPREEEEGIHYGEIDFSKRRSDPSSVSVQDSGQQQDTLYVQVRMSKPANSCTPAAGGPEDLYAQVKKK